MIIADPALDRAKHDTLALLTARGAAVPPGELIALLCAQGHADATVRAAIWYLIDWGEVALTPAFDMGLPAGKRRGDA